MTDSVALKINDFVLYSDEYFSKAKKQEFKGRFGLFGRYQTQYTDYANKLKKDKRYFPQVSIVLNQRLIPGSKGQFSNERYLLVQASLPKLIYSTSIFDIDERFIGLVTAKLKEVLAEIKIGVSEQAIKTATVCRIDYSKVLRIAPAYGTTAEIIRYLAQFDSKPSSEFNQNKFHTADGKRGGMYIKFYNSSQGLVIYDKFEEIASNGSTILEESIRKEYHAGRYKKGALRIELSLQLKQTVESTLRRFYKDKRSNFTLEEAMRNDISKQLLIEAFEKVYQQGYSGLVYLSSLKDKELVNVIHSTILGFNHQTALFYLAHRVRQVGLKQAIVELKGKLSPATTTRYKKELGQIFKECAAVKDKVNLVGYLKQRLEAFNLIVPEQLKHVLA